MQRAILLRQHIDTEPELREDGSFERGGTRYARLEACARELGVDESALRRLLGPEARRGRLAFVVKYFAWNGTRYLDIAVVERLARCVPPGRDPAGAKVLDFFASDGDATESDIPGLSLIGAPMLYERGVGMRPVKPEDLVEDPELKIFVRFAQKNSRRDRRPAPRPPVELEANRLEASLWLALLNASSGQRYVIKRDGRSVAVLGPVDGRAPEVIRSVSRAVFERRVPYYLDRAEVGEPHIVRVRPWMANEFALLAGASTGGVPA